MNYQDEFDKECRQFWEDAIYAWIHNETDRQMLKRKYLDGVNFEPLAEEFEISVNHCQKRVDKARKQLFKHIKIE